MWKNFKFCGCEIFLAKNALLVSLFLSSPAYLTLSFSIRLTLRLFLTFSLLPLSSSRPLLLPSITPLNFPLYLHPLLASSSPLPPLTLSLIREELSYWQWRHLASSLGPVVVTLPFNEVTRERHRCHTLFVSPLSHLSPSSISLLCSFLFFLTPCPFLSILPPIPFAILSR
jgi:hypothetical protein